MASTHWQQRLALLADKHRHDRASAGVTVAQVDDVRRHLHKEDVSIGRSRHGDAGRASLEHL